MAFFAGIAIVLIGYPLVGMIVETYGFILLFGGFLPATVEFLRRVPGNFELTLSLHFFSDFNANVFPLFSYRKFSQSTHYLIYSWKARRQKNEGMIRLRILSLMPVRKRD